jgi:hypothetical protein
MNVNALKANLSRVIALRDEIEAFQKPSEPFSYSLSDYVSEAYDRVINGYPGERDRFFVPHSVAVMKLQDMLDIEHDKLNSAFATNRTKLISILNRYIKGLQRGFQEHDLEAGPIPPA